MIVSVGRRYIFVHIPKTGGSSLALALEGRAMRDDILIGDTPKAKRRRNRLQGLKVAGRLWKHATLADIDGLLERDQMAQMLVFTMVRNPWDRVASYYHWLREQSFDHPAVHLAQSVEFGDFLRDRATQDSLAAHPAASYVRRPDGTLGTVLFIRLEHFAQDAAPLEQHLGFKIDLPHINASSRDQDYRNYYTTELRDLIASCCAEDIGRFGYKFESG